MLADDLASVLCSVQSMRVNVTESEHVLHTALADTFRAAHLDFAHEVQLAPRCRIDFVVSGIGVEVKKGKPNAAQVHAQLSRYVRTRKLRAVVLIVERSVSLFTTTVIDGVPVRVVALNKLWGISL